MGKSDDLEAEAIRTLDDVERLLGQQTVNHDVQLGKLLLAENVITPGQLHKALRVQDYGEGRHLGQILIDMGALTPEQLNVSLVRKLGIPHIDLKKFVLHREATALLSPDIAFRYNVVPLGTRKNVLYVAMENPLDHSLVDLLRFNTRRKVEAVMAPLNDIQETLARLYSDYDGDAALEDLKAVAPSRELATTESQAALEREARKRPIVRLVNALIVKAVTHRASDINIRPEKDQVHVYFRIDGKLQVERSLPKSLLPIVVSRIKIIGQMDIAERRLPQDGRARLARDDLNVDLRISVIPTIMGESVAIRILNKDVGVKALDELGFDPRVLKNLRALLRRTHGLFLVTGPTGSGKSTTLYSLLNEVRKRNVHVLTVEDPVEYHMNGVEQVQIMPNRGYTFAEALRHFLRHDPDVIMVGEIRDEETATIANKAALTGHLVFSTLHTNDAPTTVARLLEMGIEPYLLATTLLGVLAQRLVRLNCPHCRVEDRVDPVVRRALRLPDSVVFYRGQGCTECRKTGYLGRTIVSELMITTPEIASLIHDGSPAAEITRAAVKQGMQRLTKSAMALAVTGKTTLAEVLSVWRD